MLSGPILKSKGMCAIFQKKGKKRAKNLKKRAKKYTKFENIEKRAGDFV